MDARAKLTLWRSLNKIILSGKSMVDLALNTGTQVRRLCNLLSATNAQIASAVPNDQELMRKP